MRGSIDRRRFLLLSGTAVATALAGCTEPEDEGADQEGDEGADQEGDEGADLEGRGDLDGGSLERATGGASGSIGSRT